MQRARKPAIAELPPKFYRLRQLVSDQVTYCILLDPSVVPSRQEFPREIISSEPLRDVIALSIVDPAEKILQHLVRKHGLGYARNLMSLGDCRHPSAVFIWHAKFYMDRLMKIERKALAFERACQLVTQAAAEFEAEYSCEWPC